MQLIHKSSPMPSGDVLSVFVDGKDCVVTDPDGEELYREPNNRESSDKEGAFWTKMQSAPTDKKTRKKKSEVSSDGN